MSRRGWQRWVYFLPILRLCACLTSMIGIVVPSLQYWGIAWGYILLLDLPISLVAFGLAWKHGVLAVIWIMSVGTMWWYLLSRGAEFVFEEFIRRQKPVTLLPPSR